MQKIKWSQILTGLIVLAAVGIMVNYLYRQPKFINGAAAPDFKIALLSGDSLQLSSLRGKFVLLDFWGSWCAPCRADNPSLVALYDKHHESGLEIVSIALETNATQWKTAIEHDNLHWQYHSSELQRMKATLAEQYGVREIPTKYLLNRQGIIVGVNLSADEMDKLLARMMPQKD